MGVKEINWCYENPLSYIWSNPKFAENSVRYNSFFTESRLVKKPDSKFAE